MLYFKHSYNTNPEATHTVKQDDGANIAAPAFPCPQQKRGGRKLPSSCRAATQPSVPRSDRGDSLLVLNIQEKRWRRQEKPPGCMQKGVKEKVKRTE